MRKINELENCVATLTAQTWGLELDISRANGRLAALELTVKYLMDELEKQHIANRETT